MNINVKTILACSSRSDSLEGARRTEQEKRWWVRRPFPESERLELVKSALEDLPDLTTS